MSSAPTFKDEITNLMYATHGKPISDCLQCGTCSGTCPAVEFMDHTPRLIIGMIGAGLKEEVLESNTFWSCASCYHCSVRCPAGIDIADMMYALKRYSMWKDRHQEGLIGPAFSQSFVKMIVGSGRSFEPALAPTYLFKYGPRGLVQEAQTATGLVLKGRMPLLPKKIKGLKAFQNIVRRIIPIGDPS
ncbi:MAG: 4Fe-4S dicluster domain-containing protein [Chloroflexota bacterium]